MSPERQRQVLGGLVVLLAAIGLWQYMSAAGGTGAPAPGPATRRPAAPQVPPPPSDVALDALALARGGPDDGGRNPFVFGARPVADSGGASGPRSGRATAAPPPALPPVVPAGPSPLPPIPLKFIGFVEGTATTKKIAVLSDSKGLVVHGTEGAIIDGRYRILAIGPESIDIAYADGRGRQTLRLSGQ